MLTSLRLVRQGRLTRRRILTAGDAYRVLRPLARGLDREHFWRLDLDSRGWLLGCEVVSVGSLDATIVHPREVFKGALLSNASRIMVAHNHPSQDSRPSSEDCLTTERLGLAGRLLGVDLVDHLILTDGGFFSFKSCGRAASRRGRRRGIRRRSR
jgi:DNA repair protein RadC